MGLTSCRVHLNFTNITKIPLPTLPIDIKVHQGNRTSVILDYLTLDYLTLPLTLDYLSLSHRNPVLGTVYNGISIIQDLDYLTQDYPGTLPSTLPDPPRLPTPLPRYPR